MAAEPLTAKQRAEFEALLESVLETAYRTAYHLTRNHADAEDLVQDAALLAFRGFGRFEPGSNFRAWFLTVLRNRFVSQYRKRKRAVETVELDDAPERYLYARSHDAGLLDGTVDPARHLIGRLDAEHVARALESLPEEFREVCTLYFTQDLAYQEIADIVGRPVGTVRSRIHRGRRLLQRRLWTLAQDHGIVPAGPPGGGDTT